MWYYANGGWHGNTMGIKPPPVAAPPPPPPPPPPMPEPPKRRVRKPPTLETQLKRLQRKRVAAHPDRGGDPEEFIRINAEYEALKKKMC
jgi:hypothetical protein